MEKLGTKIKRIRERKGLSQSNLYPDNQSQVSQIESGTINSPLESTLKLIADNLDMPYKDLIKDTDYNQNQKIKFSKEYIFSQDDFKLKLDPTGKMLFTPQSYPTFDNNGNKNIYCPKYGTKLIDSCQKCNRTLDNSSASFCMGCGSELLLIKHINYLNKQADIISNSLGDFATNENHLRNDLTYIKKAYAKLLNAISEMENWNEDDIRNNEFGHDLKFKMTDWRKKQNSSIEEFSDYWSRAYTKKKLLECLKIELQKYHFKQSYEDLKNYAYQATTDIEGE